MFNREEKEHIKNKLYILYKKNQPQTKAQKPATS